MEPPKEFGMARPMEYAPWLLVIAVTVTNPMLAYFLQLAVQ